MQQAASKKIGASIPSHSDFTLKQTWGCRKETVDSKTNYAFTIRGRDTYQNDYVRELLISESQVYNCHVARSTGGDYTVSHLESVYVKNDREYRRFPWQGMVF